MMTSMFSKGLSAALNWVKSPPEAETVRRWFLTFVAVDLTFVFFHLGWQMAELRGLAGPIPASLSTFGDVGLSERFNHMKWVVLIALLALTWRRTRAAGFLALAGVFTFVLADDSLRLHERGSRWLRLTFEGMPTFGISPAEAGELIVWAMLAMIVLPLLAWGLIATPRQWRPVLGYILLAFGGLVFFGVVFDVMQEPLHWIENPSLRHWLLFAAGIIEGAGESIFASLALAYGIGIHRRYGRDQHVTDGSMSPAE